MEYSELFSRKFGLRQTPEGLLYDNVPETTRVSLFQIIFRELGAPAEGNDRYQSLYRAICRFLKIRWDWNLHHEYQYAQATEKLILNCEWHQVYEICQIAYSYMKKILQKDRSGYGWAESFQEKVNALFRDEFLGFELQNEKIEKIGNPITDAKIKEARILLKEPEFKSADELFEKAIKAFNERPNPDAENCIKDAVASIESVGKIIVKNKNAKIDNIIKRAVRNGVIPRHLGEPIIKLYVYRGDEPAIAHGGILPSQVTSDDAEFVLAISAATIIYLVKKRSQLI